MNKLSRIDITSLFFLLIFSTISVFFGLFELSLGFLAIIPLIMAIRLSQLDGSIETRVLSIAYLIGQFICWVIGFLGCIYLLSPTVFSIGKHTIVTMVLINLLLWGGLAGTLIAQPLKKNQTKASSYNKNNKEISNKLTYRGLQISGVIFVIFLVINYFTGGFFSRQDIGNTLEVGSWSYLLTGFGTLQYVFFLFLGIRLSQPLLNKSNVVILAVLLFSMLIVSLTGGRELSIRMLIYTIFGSLYSNLKIKDIRKIILVSIPFVLSFIVLIGNARSDLGFSESRDLTSRLEIITKAVTGNLQESGTDYDDPLYTTLTRLTEPTGQLVIDRVAETNSYIGLRNFERVFQIFIPKFIADKKPADDGSERLRDEYGVRITEFTNAPMTSMADAFERGGYVAVFVFSLIISFYLTKLGSWIGRLKNPLMQINLRISFAFLCLRLYTPSILGCISVVTYIFIRDALLIWVFMFIIQNLSKNSSDKQEESKIL